MLTPNNGPIGAENSTTLPFCCTACGNQLTAQSKFCDQCGLSVSLDNPPQKQTPDKQSQAHGRRYISALFTDVVSSTRLVRHLDPEQFERLMKLYQSICDQVVSDFGGKIIEVVGDGIVALFTGHENSTESAVRAGDEVIKSIDELRPFESQDGALKLEIRVGISSGEALVKPDIAARSLRILGQPPYLASRLQSLASVGQVLVCAETYQKTRGLFEYCRYPQAQLKIKGFTDVTEVWSAKGPNESQVRFEASKRINLSPLVGRKTLMNELLSLWENTTEKRGQVVIIKGPPGIGKSRILAELQQRIKRQTPDLTTLSYQCSSFAKSAPLYPIMQQISRAIQVKKGDSGEIITQKLNGLLESWGVNVEAYSPILSPLVLNTHCRDHERGLSPIEIDRAIRACTQLPIRFTRRAPVMVVVEDMQWADAASRRLLENSIHRVEKRRLMIVVTQRPEALPLPDYHAHYISEFSLKRLSPEKSRELLNSINVGLPLSSEQKQDILDKSEGVPLFIEELTLNEIRKNKSGYKQTHLKTPSSLFDLFIQRYDGFDPMVKAVAQLAAVFGLEFDLGMVFRILGIAKKQADTITGVLLEEEQIYRINDNSSWYHFKHALIRGAIYDNTLNQDKYRLHKALHHHLNSIDGVRSTVVINRIAHHLKMREHYVPFKPEA